MKTIVTIVVSIVSYFMSAQTEVTSFLVANSTVVVTAHSRKEKNTFGLCHKSNFQKAIPTQDFMCILSEL